MRLLTYFAMFFLNMLRKSICYIDWNRMRFYYFWVKSAIGVRYKNTCFRIFINRYVYIYADCCL